MSEGVKDAHIARLAGRQFNRISRAQLHALGVSDVAITHRVRAGRLLLTEEGVYAMAPVPDDDDWGLWMGATLTAPDSFVSRLSAAAAYGWWHLQRKFETITRPGSGGPERFGGVIAHRSSTLEGDCTTLRGIPITSVPRTLLDNACELGDRALARSVRDAVRLELTSVPELADALGRYRGRRGAGRLAATVARYSGIPIERARSGAEVRALEVLRDAGHPSPRLNVRIAGEEADLSWVAHRLIIEIDGRPFHLDVGEDARKEAAWSAAGWEVRRIASDDVFDHPIRLLTLAPPAERR